MPLSQSTRRVQVVSTKEQRKAVIRWMIHEVEESGTEHCIAARAVNNFPLIFTQRSHKANREKARQWWKVRDQFLNAIQSGEDKQLSLVTKKLQGSSTRRCRMKAVAGRGRRRPAWKNDLHQLLKEEFVRLRSAGLKLNRAFLLDIARSLVNDANVPITQQEIEESMGRSFEWTVQQLTLELQAVVSNNSVYFNGQDPST